MSTLITAAHAQALATPWRQVRGTSWFVVALMPLTLLPGVLTLIHQPSATGAAMGFSLALLLQVLWLWQFASLLRQNHPHAARLVPGHVRTLRDCAVGLWLLAGAATAVACGLGWGLLAGALMIVTALFVIWPWLWVSMALLPLLISLMARHHGFDVLLAAWTDSHARPALALGATLVMAWLLTRLLLEGGAVHIRCYAGNERLRKAFESNGGQVRASDFQGRIGDCFRWPLQAWTRHVLATARPTPRSRMARLDLALGGHWMNQLVGGLCFLAIVALTAAFLEWGAGLPLQQLRGDAGIGLMIAAFSATLAPLAEMPLRLDRSRGEQALLMLLPGMPRGAALNRRLGRRLLLRLLLAWSVAMLFMAALGAGTTIFWPSMAYGLAVLPGGLLVIWRDWSRLQLATSWARIGPVLLMTALGLAAMFLHRLSDATP
uniref:hypothetical protein n=1 Tax=Pelomonas sp. KK5 TaxID=1855730 RepID=UPI0018E9BFD8